MRASLLILTFMIESVLAGKIGTNYKNEYAEMQKQEPLILRGIGGGGSSHNYYRLNPPNRYYDNYKEPPLTPE